jgi:hypothetical protein
LVARLDVFGLELPLQLVRLYPPGLRLAGITPP